MSIGVGPIISFYGSPHIIFLVSSVVSVVGVVLSAFFVHYEVTAWTTESARYKTVFEILID